MELSPFWDAASSRTSQHFMESEGSLTCSQEPSTGPYPEPDQSSPYHPILSKIHFIIIHPPTLDLPSGLLWFPHEYPIHAFIFAPFVLHALPIPLSLPWSFCLHLEKSANYEDPHYCSFLRLRVTSSISVHVSAPSFPWQMRRSAWT
jgi:hypothetical protein